MVCIMQIVFAMWIVFIGGTNNRFQICTIYTFVPLFQLLFKLMKMATIVRLRMKDKGDGDQDKAAINSLRPRPNRRHFADDIFKCIFFNGNVWMSIEISLKFVPKRPINNIPALVQIMAWHRPGDKPLSEPMMVSSTTHICVTRPQWVYWSDDKTIY